MIVAAWRSFWLSGAGTLDGIWLAARQAGWWWLVLAGSPACDRDPKSPGHQLGGGLTIHYSFWVPRDRHSIKKSSNLSQWTGE